MDDSKKVIEETVEGVAKLIQEENLKFWKLACGIDEVPTNGLINWHDGHQARFTPVYKDADTGLLYVLMYGCKLWLHKNVPRFSFYPVRDSQSDLARMYRPSVFDETVLDLIVDILFPQDVSR